MNNLRFPGYSDQNEPILRSPYFIYCFNQNMSPDHSAPSVLTAVCRVLVGAGMLEVWTKSKEEISGRSEIGHEVRG